MYNVKGKKQMDERALIIDAIKQKKTNTSKKVDFNFPEPDVIEKWAKRKKQLESFRSKPIEEWGNVEFLRYLDYMLKEFGVVRAKENTRRDSDKINHLYDRLVKRIPVDMSNHILKEFIEWWCSIWAPRLTGSEFHLNLLIQDYQINRFANRYKKEDVLIHVETQPTVPNTVTDDSVYDLGGLELLLMKRGLVIGYHILKQREMSDVMASSMIQKAVRQFSKEVLVNILKITLQGSPYPESDKVDFIFLAASALNRFGLTEHTKIPHEVYFKE